MKGHLMKKVIGLFGAMSIFTSLMTGCCEPLTEEEKQQQAEAHRQYCIEHTYQYPVCSVMQYFEISTNRYGGITNRKLAYAFTYNDNGVLRQKESYSHYEYGLTKVRLGDVDAFVVYDYGETHSCLFLTQETLSSLNKIDS